MVLHRHLLRRLSPKTANYCNVKIKIRMAAAKTIKSHHKQSFSTSSSTPPRPPPPKEGGNIGSIPKEEAPRWLQRMAPTKGGTAPPNKVESMVIGTVLILGYYAWFVDPGSWLVKSNENEKVETIKAGDDGECKA